MERDTVIHKILIFLVGIRKDFLWFLNSIFYSQFFEIMVFIFGEGLQKNIVNCMAKICSCLGVGEIISNIRVVVSRSMV